jgi:hypothetical protein
MKKNQLEAVYETRAPFDLSDEVKAKVAALDLGDAVKQGKNEGFGYIFDPAPFEFTERLRETILDLAERDHRGGGVNLLLTKDPIFEEVVLNPKILTMVEILCGKGALFSQMAGSILTKETDGGLGGLHADQNWTPAPFPEHNQIVTFCWACDEFTKEAGATKVIPKSHRHRRHPTPEESAEEKGIITTACPAGSIVFWNGSVWHDAGKRTIEGDRVVLHVNFSRLAMRPVENYDHLDENWFENRPYEMRVMLGREDFLNKPTGVSGLDDKKIWQTMAWGKT